MNPTEEQSFFRSITTHWDATFPSETFYTATVPMDGSLDATEIGYVIQDTSNINNESVKRSTPKKLNRKTYSHVSRIEKEMPSSGEKILRRIEEII